MSYNKDALTDRRTALARPVSRTLAARRPAGPLALAALATASAASFAGLAMTLGGTRELQATLGAVLLLAVAAFLVSFARPVR